MATTQKIRNDIAKTKEKIAEQQKRLRALEAQLAEEENLEIVRMVKAVKMDNKELTAFLKAYASGMISLPEGMLQEGNTENEETEEYEDETSVYKGYKRDKIEMRGDRAEISDFPLYLNTVAGGLDCRDQTIGGFSFVVKIYAVPVVEIIG